MFDDWFLLTALERAEIDKTVIISSLRKTEEVASFRSFGWAPITSGVLVSSEVILREANLGVIKDMSNVQAGLLVGDLVSLTTQYHEMIRTRRVAVAKANFVSSVTDGGAFLLPDSVGRADEQAVAFATTMIDAGMSIWASTWYRDDVTPNIVAFDPATESLGDFVRSKMPCNLIGSQDPRHGLVMQAASAAYVAQSALEDTNRPRLARARVDNVQKHEEQIASMAEYIEMLEEAMLALQHADSISLNN